jgi:hypothetical protein
MGRAARTGGRPELLPAAGGPRSALSRVVGVCLRGRSNHCNSRPTIGPNPPETRTSCRKQRFIAAWCAQASDTPALLLHLGHPLMARPPLRWHP